MIDFGGLFNYGILKEIMRLIKKIYRFKLIRYIYYLAINKKVDVSIREYRKYNGKLHNPPSDFIYVLKKAIGNINNEKFTIEDHTIGKNYAIIKFKELNVPLKIRLDSNVDIDDEGNEVINGTIIEIKTYGTLTFTYREKIKYENVLLLIDKIFEKLENKYDLKNETINYIATATIEESQPLKMNTYDETADYKVLMGNSKLEIYSKIKDPLLKLFNEYIPPLKCQSVS